MAGNDQGRLTKNERRQQAREKARQAREKERACEKRNRLLLQGGIVLGVLAIVVVVGLVIANALKPAGPGPANMASGGVVFEQDLQVQDTPALESGEKRVESRCGLRSEAVACRGILGLHVPRMRQFRTAVWRHA